MYTFVKYVIIGSNNGLAPVRRQTIIWINDVLLSIGTSELRERVKVKWKDKQSESPYLCLSVLDRVSSVSGKSKRVSAPWCQW